jgi:hypothetical protein
LDGVVLAVFDDLAEFAHFGDGARVGCGLADQLTRRLACNGPFEGQNGPPSSTAAEQSNGRTTTALGFQGRRRDVSVTAG